MFENIHEDLPKFVVVILATNEVKVFDSQEEAESFVSPMSESSYVAYGRLDYLGSSGCAFCWS